MQDEVEMVEGRRRGRRGGSTRARASERKERGEKTNQTTPSVRRDLDFAPAPMTWERGVIHEIGFLSPEVETRDREELDDQRKKGEGPKMSCRDEKQSKLGQRGSSIDSYAQGDLRLTQQATEPSQKRTPPPPLLPSPPSRSSKSGSSVHPFLPLRFHPRSGCGSRKSLQ